MLDQMLNLSGDEKNTIKQTLDQMVRKRSGINRSAKLTNPVNIGITKLKHD
jgi:hypothetical protein